MQSALRFIIPAVLLCVFTAPTFAQTNFFTEVRSSDLPESTAPAKPVSKMKIFRLNEPSMRKYLQSAPLESPTRSVALPLEIPLPNGKTETFGMMESPVLSPEVAAKHPEIKTYTGNSLSNPKTIIRLSLTSDGFNAILLNVEGDAVYFEGYAKNLPNVYFNYFARDVVAPKEGPKNKSCGMGVLDQQPKHAEDPATPDFMPPPPSGVVLKTFRIAMAANGEFTEQHGSVSSAFNAIVGYVNRMTALYRNDLGVSFTLVSGTNLIYTDTMNDPYTNYNQSLMLTQNHNNLNTVIGSANYDIGHVWGYVGGSGGGIASLESVCDDNLKGKGVSGEGDVSSYAQVFMDQLLFHEVGHQFGMTHSYNSSIPVCTTRAPGTSVEPGSGATIMSYGFTCESDDYFTKGNPLVGPIIQFHAANLVQANAYMANPTPGYGNCYTTTITSNNHFPVVTMPSAYTIPKSTPFALTASATDGDGDALTYCWEGMNVGTMTPDASTLANTAQPPFFRSYGIPDSSGPTRIYPLLAKILDGSNYAVGDKLPSVGIVTTHRLTVRDNNAAVGGVSFGDVTITVDGNIGPFLVTNDLSGSYAGLSTQTVTWSVNGTNAATPEVKILLSTDGGLTFPTVLLASTPNDGTQNITLPNVSTSTARIKVESVSNIFFDISNVNFTITPSANPTCPPNASVCINAPAFALTGGSPAGGTYSGTGVSAGMFNPATAGVGPHTITYTNGGTCTFTITVNALPTVTCPANSAVCINAPAFALTGGSPAGGTYSGTGVSAGMFNPATAGTGAKTITYSYTNANSCTNTCTYTITVNPLPTVTCPANSAVCINAPAFALTGGSPAGGTYSGTGVSAGMFNPATAGTGAKTITYSYTDANSCTNTCTYTITVNPLPTVTCPANSAVCINAPAFALTGGSPAGGTYSGTGVSAGMFNPATAGTGAKTITYSYTDANSCTNTCTYTITVNPLPTVTCPANFAVLVTDPAFALTGGSPAGGTYSGTGVSSGMFNPATAGTGAKTITYSYTDANLCTNSCTFTITVNAPGVSCPANLAVCINAPAFVLTGGSPAGGTYSGTGVSAGMFNPATAGVGPHTITYSNGGTCTFTITVNALPTVTCPANSAVCINASAFALTGGSPAGGTYSGAGVSAGMFNPATAGMGAKTITYSYTDANSCTNTCTYTIMVNPLPTVTCPANSAVCINAPAFALTGGSPAGGTYSGAGVSAGMFNPATAGTGAKTITYSYTDANSCTNTCTYTITVNPLPTVTCPANSAVCINAPAFALTGGSPVGGTYSGAGVSAGMFNPATAGTGAKTITYSYTDANSCTNTCTYTITVNPLPTVTCPGNSTVNITDPAFALTGASPAGGTYSGGGVNAGMFNPNTAGVGPHTITYSYTDANSCTSTCTFTITVNTVVVTCPASFSVCINTPAFALTGGSPAGGVYSGTGVSAGMFNPATAGVGSHTITYTNGGSCNFTITVTNGSGSNVSFTLCPGNRTANTAANLCSAVVTYAASASGTPAPALSYTFTGATTGQGSGTGSGASFNKGITQVVLVASNVCGTATCSFTVTVNDLQPPTITCPANQFRNTDAGLCSAVATYATPAFTDNCPNAGVALQSGLASGAAFPKGVNTVVWRATDAAGLTKTCTFRVTVNDVQAPTITCPANQVKTTDANQCTAVTIYDNATFTDNCAGGTVVKISGLNSGSAFPKGSSNVIFKATDAAGNFSVCTMTVTVTDGQLPAVSCPASISVTGTISNGVCNAMVNFTNPTATDNCAVQSSYLLSGLASGSMFPLGVTNNTWKVTDNSGLTVTCSFSVTVSCGTSPEGTMSDERRTMNGVLPSSFIVHPLLFTMAPNPASTEVQVIAEGLDDNGGELWLTDALGRVILRQLILPTQTEIGQANIHLSSLSPGLYQVSLRTERGVVTKGLVVSRL